MIHFSFSLRRLGQRPPTKTVISRCMLRAFERSAAPEPLCPSGGPGWFDSSWDLIRGLEVHESASDPAVAERDERPGARLVPAAPHGAFVDALQLGDLDCAEAAEVTHLDRCGEFGDFGIDNLELV